MTKTMTIDDAHALALEKANELKAKGIDVTIKPFNWGNRTEEEKSELIEKYPVLAHSKWVKVTFLTKNNVEAQMVSDAASYLGMAGISFDNGGCGNSRDWELDWSFDYTGEENAEWVAAKNEVEETLQEGGGDCEIHEEGEVRS